MDLTPYPGPYDEEPEIAVDSFVTNDGKGNIRICYPGEIPIGVWTGKTTTSFSEYFTRSEDFAYITGVT